MPTTLPNPFRPLVAGPQTVRNRIFPTGHVTVTLENGLPGDATVAYHQAPRFPPLQFDRRPGAVGAV